MVGAWLVVADALTVAAFEAVETILDTTGDFPTSCVEPSVALGEMKC